MHRIAINTGGGDAPGLNAVIHAVVMGAHQQGWEVIGIRDGFDSILYPELYHDEPFIALTPQLVCNFTHIGGTYLGTTNRGNPLKLRVTGSDGVEREVDRGNDIVDALKKRGVDALVTVGGDGSLRIGQALYERGLRVVGVPKTIDNDLQGTVVTFGFNSAVSFATECIDRLHTTAASHRRVLVVEVMGRYVGWIALHSGVAGRADAILIPEIPYNIQKVAENIRRRYLEGDRYSLIVVAEGAMPKGGEISVKERKAGESERLGGIGERIATELQTLTGYEARSVTLGHLLRGGSPTAFDRNLGLSLGAAAVRALTDGQNGVMVAYDPPDFRYVPLKEAVSALKRVPPEGDLVLTGKTLGICFGD